MNANEIIASRAQLIAKIFPDSPPLLWCPTLTHYNNDGAIDRERIAAHWRHISPHVTGLLVPGSTGDGWELSDAEVRVLLSIAISEARKLGLKMLVGILKAGATETLQTLRATMQWMRSESGCATTEETLAQTNVCGFTVCAPVGAHLSQPEISDALANILKENLPTAIYQLPQVTQNEIEPGTISALQTSFPNFIFFKDTSGKDRAILAKGALQGVFTVRGAEGDYARWLKIAGGPYDGFLLSTANCFAEELSQMIQELKAGQTDSAHEISGRLTAVINETFKLTAPLAKGNAFTNANKAIDHYFAFGPKAAEIPPPMLHSRERLPIETIRDTGVILKHHRLMPARGYLEG